MKFKVKLKSRVASLEEKLKKMEKKNSDLALDMTRSIYKIEEDTIKKIIKIETEVKNKMDTSSVYDHVSYATDNLRQEQNKIIEKLENQ